MRRPSARSLDPLLNGSCELERLPTLSFRLGPHRLELQPRDYVLHHSGSDASDASEDEIVSCAFALQALDVDEPALWVFGDVFLR